MVTQWPPYSADAAIASATAPEGNYDDIVAISREDREPTSPPLPPPIPSYDDVVTDNAPPLPPKPV